MPIVTVGAYQFFGCISLALRMSVKVKRERPDQRRHHRVAAPLLVDIKGTQYRADDWSVGGLNICGLRGPLPAPGDPLALEVTLPFQGFDIKFAVNSEVVHNDAEDAMIGVKFLDLGEREAKLMQHFVEDIVRGAMSSVDDTIQRIDVPVTPASTKPDPNPRDEVPIRRWPIKTICFTAAYLLAGIVVFSYAAMLVFANFVNLEVRSAVISAPLEQVKAQAEGRVRWTNFQPGDAVLEGDVVLRMYDNKIEREIELAQLAVKERTNEIAYLMRRKVDEIEKVSALARIETKDIAQAKLRQESLSEQVDAARLVHVRAEHLYSKGHSPATKVEEARKRLIDLEKRLASQKLELETRIALAEKNIGKRYFTGREMIGEIQRASAEIKRAQGLLELDKQRYEVAKSARDRRAVAAPFTGTILQLPRLHNGHVKAGETIALFEKSGERGITAFLTQDEVLDIELGGFVEVYIPATGEIARAQIIDIDRTMGFFRQASKRSPVRLQWREAKERTARVSLAFVDSHEISGDSRYRAGLPVTVNFSRKAGGYIQARVKRSAQQMLSYIPGRSLFAQSAEGLWQAYRNNNRRLGERVRDYFGDAPKQPAADAQLPSRLGQIAEGFVLDPRMIPRKAAQKAAPSRPELEL